jgi:hypothetical protein
VTFGGNLEAAPELVAAAYQFSRRGHRPALRIATVETQLSAHVLRGQGCGRAEHRHEHESHELNCVANDHAKSPGWSTWSEVIVPAKMRIFVIGAACCTALDELGCETVENWRRYSSLGGMEGIGLSGGTASRSA